MAISASWLGLLLLWTVDASDPSAWEKTVIKNAAAARSIIAAASTVDQMGQRTMEAGWGDATTAKMSYDAYPINKLVDPQSQAYIPLLKDMTSSEINRKAMDWYTASHPLPLAKQEIDWLAVVLGSEGKTILTSTKAANEGEVDGKKSTTVSSYISRWFFDDDNKAYKVTDFFPVIPSASDAGCAAEALAAPAKGISTAVAFCAGALTSAALAAAMMIMGASWKKRASPTAALHSPLLLT